MDNLLSMIILFLICLGKQVGGGGEGGVIFCNKQFVNGIYRSMTHYILSRGYYITHCNKTVYMSFLETLAVILIFFFLILDERITPWHQATMR